jgi:hypothetical protein
MRIHLADLSAATDYKVRLEFTAPLEPSIIAEGMPFVSLLDEIEANSSTAGGSELRAMYGRIPYGSPLYWWETHSAEGIAECVYIGQTVRLRPQKRFERHATVTQLLARYANQVDIRVMFRLCSRFDLLYGGDRYGIEHLPPAQASRVVHDVEAYLIHWKQPHLNKRCKGRPRRRWKPFVVEEVKLG